MNSRYLLVLLLLSISLNVVLFLELQKQQVVVQSPEERIDVTEETITSGLQYPFIRVVDGDTITVGLEGRIEYVRLIGIDAPEPNYSGVPACYADEATRHLRTLLDTGTVILHFDASQGMRDKYGRLLAYVEVPTTGFDAGESMLRGGYAREYTYEAPYEKQSLYREAETAARTTQAGLWNADACN